MMYEQSSAGQHPLHPVYCNDPAGCVCVQTHQAEIITVAPRLGLEHWHQDTLHTDTGHILYPVTWNNMA
ncbi:hypothetical protein XELAEV_18010407mg [Xenopus laevis]|uniref:Uncharacterized protein n=1 Tax=Xenopus laevis TaxID=8355 RepID=A0A974I1A7_XENLA|nr:hypothetical protein XELAEV_18010407mg [Xenopus laevis]